MPTRLSAQQPVEVALERLDVGRLTSFGLSIIPDGRTGRIVQGNTAIVSQTFKSIVMDSVPTIQRWYNALVRHQLLNLEMVGRGMSVGEQIVIRGDSIQGRPGFLADVRMQVDPDGWWHMTGMVTWGSQTWPIDDRCLEYGAVIVGSGPWVIRIQPLGRRRTL